MLHSRKLRYIDEVTRLGSIRKAAARLNVASSAINRQILALEDELGVPIFERLPRGLRLTAAGEILIEHIREVLKSSERMERRIRNLKRPQIGKVSVVTTGGLATGPLPDILAHFMVVQSRISVRLLTDAGSVTWNAVLSGEADLGIGFNVPAMPGLRAVAGFDVPVGVVMPPGHRLAAMTAIEPMEVLREKLVICSPDTSLRDAINLILAPFAVPMEPILETSSIDLMKKLVARGAGLTLLNPLDVHAECARGELVFRPIVPAYLRHQQLKIFARARTTLDSSTTLFLEYLLERLAQMVQDLQDSGQVPRPDETVG